MLSQDRAALAPEKARRGMIFTYGTKKLGKMNAKEQEEAYQAFLKLYLSDEIQEAGNWYLECSFRSSTEDGLSLSYLPNEDKLVRLESHIMVEPPEGLMGTLANVLNQSSIERETAHMRALTEFGWPLLPRSNWEECRARFPDMFAEWIIGQESSEGSRTFRRVLGLANGLYYELNFFNQELVQVDITDPELVRECALSQYRQSREEQEISRASSACLGTLRGVMAYLYDNIGAEEESFTLSDKQAGAPALDSEAADMEGEPGEPEWLRTLSTGQQEQFQSLMMNTDMEVLGQLMPKLAEFSSLEHFIQEKDALLGTSENQKRIADERRSLARQLGGRDAAGRSSARRVKKIVRETVMAQLNLHFGTKLSGNEALIEDLQATDDDLHLIRAGLNGALNINFRTPHWDDVRTVEELEAKALHLCEHPDMDPREDVPLSALRKMSVQPMMDSFENAALGIKENFERQCAEFQFAAQ